MYIQPLISDIYVDGQLVRYVLEVRLGHGRSWVIVPVVARLHLPEDSPAVHHHQHLVVFLLHRRSCIIFIHQQLPLRSSHGGQEERREDEDEEIVARLVGLHGAGLQARRACSYLSSASRERQRQTEGNGGGERRGAFPWFGHKGTNTLQM